MANILNNNFHNLKLKPNHDEYWDLFLNKDSHVSHNFRQNGIHDECLRAYIDVSQDGCVKDNIINGLDGYKWEFAHTTTHTLQNIGYTGFDNGLLSFKKDRILNTDFINLYQNSSFTVEGKETLQLHQVSGSTMVYDYPLTVEDFQVKLNGGFYQGFFKTECDKYQILPSKMEDGDVWAYEFVLKKTDFEKESTKTLNDKYPNNKGIFFYIGTRAENKWIYLYDDTYHDDCHTFTYDDYIDGVEIDPKTYKINNFLDVSLSEDVFEEKWEDTATDDFVANTYYHNNTIHHSPNMNEEKVSKGDFFGDNYLSDTSVFEGGDCLDTDYIEGDVDISNIEYTTNESFKIGKYEEFFDVDNKFLLFNRTCEGFNVKNWEEGSSVRYITERNDFDENLFLLMNRTCTGHNVNTIETLKRSYKKEYDLYKDLYNNALAFRITDDGAIGYRYLVQDCEGEKPYKILEGYSKNHIVPKDEWCVIHVKIHAQLTTMQLRFYVNGNLVFITDPMPKLQLKALDEIMEKQETVPFNISLGGGTQGLCDVILPNYMIDPYRVYPLEKHFGGSFIGYFKSFKFYDCDMEYLDIMDNFKNEMSNLGLI